jgi:hypothetical protein
MKTATIKVSHPHIRRIGNTNKVNENAYRVEQVTDSVEFAPGQLLDKEEVKELCSSSKWRVTIVASKQG